MDIKFYEMHFQPAESLISDASNFDKTSFSLLCMTERTDAFCAVSDKVYHVKWDTTRAELGRQQIFSATSSSSSSGTATTTTTTTSTCSNSNVVVSLHVLHGNHDNTAIIGVVYGHGDKWTLTVFQIDTVAYVISYQATDTLQLKPNLLCLSRDISTDNITVVATFYNEPCVEMFTYSLSGFLTKVESNILKMYYPGLYRCRGTIDRRNSSTDLKRVPDYIISMDALVQDNETRYLAYGTVDGKVHINVSNSTETLWSDLYDWEGPISALRLFTVRGQVCLVVCCMVEQVVLFTNINEETKLSKELQLPDSSLYDSPTCVTIMDINHDGEPEILVGTYGCCFLVYKPDFSQSQVSAKLVYFRQFNSPIYSICFSDITVDGLYEVLLLSFNGIHILQRCLSAAKRYLDNLLYEIYPAVTNHSHEPVVS